MSTRRTTRQSEKNGSSSRAALNVPSPNLSGIDGGDTGDDSIGMESDSDNEALRSDASSADNDSDSDEERRPAKKSKAAKAAKSAKPATRKKAARKKPAADYKPVQYFIDRVGHDIMLQPGATAVDAPEEECLIRSEPEGGFEGIQRDVSITISLKKRNIQGDKVLERMENFFKFRCIQGIGSTEKGYNEDNLHFQGVARLVASSTRAVAEEIKKALGWTKNHTPAGMNVMCRGLTGIGLHTMDGMIGYCTKDEGAPHFRLISHNVSQEQIEVGKMEYIKHGKGDLKGKVLLDMRNLYQKAHIFYERKMPNSAPRNEISLIQVLTQMMRTGVFYPAASWVVPTAGRGMPMWRANSLWKCMTTPEDMKEEDVANIFFEHDSEDPIEEQSWGRYFESKRLRDSTQRTVEKRKRHPLPAQQQHLGAVNGQDFVAFANDSDSDIGEREERIRDWASVGTDIWVYSGKNAQASGPRDDEEQESWCPSLVF